jgi:hypothetical protein
VTGRAVATVPVLARGLPDRPDIGLPGGRPVDNLPVVGPGTQRRMAADATARSEPHRAARPYCGEGHQVPR